jgi:hypothetical protein
MEIQEGEGKSAAYTAATHGTAATIADMSRRLVAVLAFLAALLYAQQAALWHDVGHLQAGTPASIDCDTHYLCSQVGGGPVSTPPVVALDFAAGPPASFLRQRDASIPARLAYRAQAPPASPA